jgi:predicted DCC family thiol-disulfide oxidoreductase YuxK
MIPLKNASIILFDGYCNLCNASVDFVIKHDKKNYFLLTSLQSDASKNILLQLHQKSFKNFDSVVLISRQKIYYQSDAALRIAKNLSGFIKLFYIFIIVPKPLRDMVYNYIAKNRYAWFGKKKTCRLPTADDLGRFL